MKDDKRVEDFLDVMIDGKNTRLFMSWATLREVLRAIGSPENATVMMLSPDLQEDAAIVVLTRNIADKKNESSLDAFNMDVETGDRLVTWITEHALDFFTRGVTAMDRMSDKIKALAPKAPADTPVETAPTLASLASLPSGSPVSLS